MRASEGEGRLFSTESSRQPFFSRTPRHPSVLPSRVHPAVGQRDDTSHLAPSQVANLSILQNTMRAQPWTWCLVTATGNWMKDEELEGGGRHATECASAAACALCRLPCATVSPSPVYHSEAAASTRARARTERTSNGRDSRFLSSRQPFSPCNSTYVTLVS